MAAQGPQTVLITGASGLLGRAFMRKFSEKHDWKVVGLAHSRAGNGLVKVDLLDEKALRSTLLENKPNVIIHSAAERNCNTVDNKYEAAFNLNVNASKRIAELAAGIGALLVYISTDYVFDGNNPPYAENDTPNPLNKYGVTKLEGENVTLEAHKGSCVLRVPVLYGQVENLQESVVCGLLQNLIDVNKKCAISDYEIRYPTLVDDVAEACYRLVNYALQSFVMPIIALRPSAILRLISLVDSQVWDIVDPRKMKSWTDSISALSILKLAVPVSAVVMTFVLPMLKCSPSSSLSSFIFMIRWCRSLSAIKVVSSAWHFPPDILDVYTKSSELCKIVS